LRIAARSLDGEQIPLEARHASIISTPSRWGQVLQYDISDDCPAGCRAMKCRNARPDPGLTPAWAEMS